ncbi:MAG: recombinase family protein, partial [Candidatus Dormibacteria bacterium]
MSEAELHVLRARLIGGQLAKARRGELEVPLPVGLVYDAAGKVMLDPDRSVQEAIGQFFETFRRTGSATATVRSFREQGLLFPRRAQSGPHKGDVIWGSLLHYRALNVLKNPRYAGAFAYGRSQAKKTLQGNGSRHRLPQDQWHTLIHDAIPATSPGPTTRRTWHGCGPTRLLMGQTAKPARQEKAQRSCKDLPSADAAAHA